MANAPWVRRRPAGDSAHRTPPFPGQGMCAGIRDAANLARKLEWAAAGERLLDTCETERSPHMREFIELAVRLGAVIRATDPDATVAPGAILLPFRRRGRCS